MPQSQNTNADKDNERKYKIVIVILLIVTAVSILIAAAALHGRERAVKTADSSSTLDYAPVPIADNALPIAEKSDDSDKDETGGSKVSLVYSDVVELSLESKTADIMFQNPDKSNQDIMLDLTIDGKVIASSGRIPVGYQIDKLENVDTDKLVQGTYEGKFQLTYYDSSTAEKSVVGSEIPVKIVVK